MCHRVTPEIVDVAARNGFGLNLHHYPGAGSGQPDPVIVVHGAAFRLNLFLAPAKQAFVDALPEAGYRWCRGGSTINPPYVGSSWNKTILGACDD